MTRQDVQLELLPAEHLAVSAFSGRLRRDPENDPRALAKRNAVVADAKKVGLLPEAVSPGEVPMQVFRYNPPWALPFFRRNEGASTDSCDEH